MPAYILDLGMEVSSDELVGRVLSSRRGNWPSSCHDTRPPEGGRFISVQRDGMLISAYYHPSRNHTATVVTGRVFDKKDKASAPPGRWAVATIYRDISGRDRTFYDVQ